MDLTTQADDAALVNAARAGDGAAFGVLFDRWFARVNDVAYRIVRDREVAADVAQDAFLAAWTGLDRLEQVDSFGGWLLRIARNRALNRLERERRSIPVGDEETTVLDRSGPDDDQASTEAARAEDAELVWTAAAALGPRDASVLDLHLRHGLSAAEIAEELGVAPNAAHQTLFRLRSRLGDAVRACVLWRGGSPACSTLDRELAAAGAGAFGAATARTIRAHAADCVTCTARQESRLSPEALFAAAPLLLVDDAVRDTVRRGLANAGVPVDAPPKSSPSPAAEVVGGTAGKVGRTRAAAVAAAGVIAIVIAALVLLAGDDGDEVEDVAAAEPTSTTTATTATADGPTTSAPADDPDGGPLVGGTATTSAPVGSLPAPGPTSTTPPTTGPADIGSVPTDPPLAPDTGSRPTTTTTTTTAPVDPPTTPPPPAEPPRILSFTATRTPGPGGCPGRPRAKITLSWRTAAADTITIAGPGASSDARPTFGTATVCSLSAATYVLTATGPGGTVTQPASVGPPT